MRFFIHMRLGLVAGLLAAVSGCQPSPQEKLLQKWIAHIEEAREILAGVDGKDSALAALPKLLASLEAFEQVVGKTIGEAGPAIPKAEDERLNRNYGDQFETAGNKFRSQRDRIKSRHPEAWQILADTVAQVKGVMSPAERLQQGMNRRRGF